MNQSPVTRWHEPDGVNVRGTVLVFPGRGESAATYWRLGARLAADAYRVVVASPESAATEIAGAARPLVALGSDTGVLDAVAFTWAHDVDAVIAAGVPAGDADEDALLADVTARTACSVHQDVLERDADDLVGVIELEPVTIGVDVPLLALHGDADRISPLDQAAARYRELGAAEVQVVGGALHDVLNDLTHRSVAARIVTFLEELRAGAPLVTPQLLGELVRA